MPGREAGSDDVCEIGSVTLTLDDVARLARPGLAVQVTAGSWERVDATTGMVQRAIEEGVTVYGVTTGFGALSDQTISADESRALQSNLLRSHASGTGTPLPDETVRLMLAFRAHALAQGYSGVRRELIEHLVAMFNAGVLPEVPAQGSVGASGDLAPLAHLALPLIGEGRVRFRGETLDAGDGLSRAGLRPIRLEPKEALALINGTQAMTAIAALAQLRARRVLEAACGAVALTTIALAGRTTSFDPQISRVRPHPGQQRVAALMRELLGTWEPDQSSSRSVQDRYSLRAVPQVLGAIVDTLDFCRSAIEIEINSATDNPLFFPETGQIINGANFHGHPIALACDHLKTAVASLTTFAERRVASLVDPRASGLAPFLTPNPGLNSGLMIAHYLTASLVSENRVLAHPASVDSLSTSADVEDYNSMGMLAARNLETVVENASRVVAVELICASQAIDLQAIDPSDIPAGGVYRKIRGRVPFLESDRFGVGDWIESLARAIRDGEIETAETSLGSGRGEMDAS